MNVLSIGNSFSQDAQRYVHEIAKSDGENVNTFNLYIGGCSLETHYNNMKSGDRAYLLEMNGQTTWFYVTLEQALKAREWDYVTFQQVSNLSVNYSTYKPFLQKIVSCVREMSPTAKILLHQTWAYEEDCERLVNELGYLHHTQMMSDIKKAVETAKQEVGADVIIPSGELIEKLFLKGIKVHRDTYHLSLGASRYAVGLLWYAFLTGKSILKNKFSSLDEKVSFKQKKLIKKLVTEIYNQYN